MNKIKNKIGAAFYRAWEHFSPTMSEHFQAFDLRMFLNNEMDPRFPWKNHVEKKNEYFQKWGFSVSQLDAEYYSHVSGIRANHYVTRSMAVHYIYPFLDRYDFLPAYMDKNAQRLFLRLPDPALDIEIPETVICNNNGIFFDANDNECSEDDALDLLVSNGEDTILKPSVESYGGHGIIKASSNITREEYKLLFDKYRYNYIFQKIIKQHPILAQFNESSVNTIRIVTYRDFNKVCKILYACLRFGGEGSVMDNVCSGGGFTGINIKTGKLLDRKRHTYFQMDSPLLSEQLPNEIPFWNKLVKSVLSLHGRLPQLNIVGWDFTLTPEGKVVLIEFNPRPGVGLQQAVGPMFCKEDLDEIMTHIAKPKASYHPFPVVRFSDFPERKTVLLKFLGM